jgi:hypothetical protein
MTIDEVLEINELNLDEVFQYLDELRESGDTNMYGAGPYVQREFGLDRNEARILVLEWMNTFSERHPK